MRHRRLRALTALLTAWTAACADGERSKQTETPDTTSTDTGEEEAWQRPEGGEIELLREDGLRIVADYYPASQQGRPAVVLLHSYAIDDNRGTWSPELIEAILAEDWALIVPDLRGYGESQGDAIQGYFDPLDIAACAERVLRNGYGPFAVLPSGNSGDQINPYAYRAATMGDIPQPAAIGYLGGGRWNESVSSMETVPLLPTVFVETRDDGEAWAEQYEGQNPDYWTFLWITGDDLVINYYGEVFTHRPELIPPLIEFWQDAFDRWDQSE